MQKHKHLHNSETKKNTHKQKKMEPSILITTSLNTHKDNIYIYKEAPIKIFSI